MSDAFWAALFTAAPILLGVWLAHIRQMRSLANNTDVTVKGQNAIYQKVDSTEKSVTEKITTTGNEVKTEAVKTAKGVAIIAQATANSAKAASREVIQQLVPIVEKLNGGPNGLTALTTRVTELEVKYDLLVKGQIDIVKSINHFAEVIERKQFPSSSSVRGEAS